MSNIIEVRNISKEYRIGERMSYGSLRDEIMEVLKAPFKKFGAPRNEEDNTIWALKDVSFDVKEGEVVGIIGRNGAGKSTLLKILSRITEPTSGRITMKGRVASLLEVGTGFHPELTGRENILLNGALLGMTRVEIKSKFDEIVAFSEIEKFLDTPVKRYSSGMYVRLAFAVAAHLEPEILVIDEVLAVGDAGFQKKCLGKMGEVAEGGRTVLFVSHNMSAVASLTARCVELTKGVVTMSGATAEVIEHYVKNSAGHGLSSEEDGVYDLRFSERPLHKVNPKTAKAVFVKATCSDKTGRLRSQYEEEEPIHIDIYVEVREKLDLLELHLGVQDSMDAKVFSVLSDVMEISMAPGTYRFGLDISPNYLRPGRYYGGFSIYTPLLQDGIRPGLEFTIEPSSKGYSNINWSAPYYGVVKLPYYWREPVKTTVEML